MIKEILFQQLERTPQDNDIKSKFFFLVPRETYVSWLWDAGIAAFLINEDCNLEQFNEILENLEPDKRAKAMLFTFCPCLETRNENENLNFILENQILKFTKDSWKIFWKKDYENSEDFKIQVEKYIESHKEHSSGNVTAFINAPKQMKCGDWICDEQGIYQLKRDKKTEENYQVFASKQQILLTGIIEDIETKEQQYGISFSFKRNSTYIWKTIYTDPAICSSKTKIINLANQGIRVIDKTATQLINYLDDLHNLNEEDIPVKESIRHLGWIGDRFFPYEQEIIFNGDSRQKDVVAAIHEQGDFNLWKNTFQEFRKNLTFRLITDTCLASVLIEKIGGLCFILHLWGGTGKGKTASLMAAASIWGEPEKLLVSADATDNYATNRASLFKSLPVMIDETQVTSNKLDKLIYLLTEGRTRGRLDRTGKERNVNTWFCSTVITGEKPLINEKSAAGASNRVIELSVDEPLFADFEQVFDVIQENYGFAGKRFVEYIQKQDLSKLKKEYNEIQKEIRTLSDATGKQASSLAFIVLADRIANECIFDDEKSLPLDELISILKTETEVSQAERAYSFIIDWIAANQNYFINADSSTDFNNGLKKIFGKIEKNFCYISQLILIEILSENNFDFDAIKKDWAVTGYLEKNSANKYQHYTTVGTIKAKYIKIKLLEEDFKIANQKEIPFRK